MPRQVGCWSHVVWDRHLMQQPMEQGARANLSRLPGACAIQRSRTPLSALVRSAVVPTRSGSGTSVTADEGAKKNGIVMTASINAGGRMLGGLEKLWP